MSSLEPDPAAWAETLRAKAIEAGGLRYASYTIPQDTPGRLNLLQDFRRRLDRIEQIYVDAQLTRTRIKLLQVAARAEREEQWDRANVATRNAPGRDQYLGSRERYADANLVVLDLTRAQRRIENELDRVDGMVEAIRTMHRGLDGARQDLLQLIKSGMDYSTKQETQT